MKSFLNSLKITEIPIGIILLAGLIFALSSCKKNVDTACNLAKSAIAPSAMDITFKAVKTGDGTISSLTYKVGNTEKTVTDPRLPWSVTLGATKGSPISITATGRAKNGSLTISYNGENATGAIHGSDFCKHSN